MGRRPRSPPTISPISRLTWWRTSRSPALASDLVRVRVSVRVGVRVRVGVGVGVRVRVRVSVGVRVRV